MNKLDVKTKKSEAASSQWLSNLRFYGDEFLFDKVSGSFYRLSPSATFLLRSLEENKGTEYLVDQIQKEYGINHSRAVRDVEMFLNDLNFMGVLDPSDFQLPSQEIK